MNPLPAYEFRGNGRFEVRARIGQGAVGIVYDAFDRDRNARVALKTLRTTNPETLLLLKKEFRAVQDLLHPNLVHMGELFEEKGTWFFSMEHVQGTHFVQYVRPHDPRARGSMPVPSLLPQPPPASVGLDEARLRAALPQLVRGLIALHDGGKIHRDVKPSNILVTESGRVVILDFGIVAELTRDAEESDHGMLGTAAYMAPEQALGEAVGEAADWYALGVVLYQSLTGRQPFHGAMHEIMAKKLQAPPPPASSIQANVPSDLDALCTELLRMAPEERPTGRRILEMLGCAAEERTSEKHLAVFVGRSHELAALEEAYAHVCKGNAVTVFVHGESGVGKSFLVKQFLDEARERDRTALVIAGRCYERESVPYKAVDGVVDQLSRHLQSLRDKEVAALLPEHAGLLARAFPVLGAFAQAHANDVDVVNPQELRTRVFSAMRELFARIANHAPLIVSIDDLQWADVDSLALLADVMRPPDAPKMLLVATMRVATEQMTRGKYEQTSSFQITGDVRNVDLDQLPRDEARALAARLLGSDADEAEIDIIVREANGHPLYIDELVRQRATPQGGKLLRLDDALWARAMRLESPARRLLELVAVAGLPIAQEVAAQAAAIDLAQLFDLAGVLRASHFVKTAGAQKDDAIEPYHDRVRESVLAHLGLEERGRWHGRLAAALEQTGSSDAEALATHWEGAGHSDRAADYAETAADAAMHSLAFERAARLYRRCLALRPHEKDEIRDLKGRLAEALTNAGYVSQAAEVYIDLASDAAEVASLDLRRRAAEQLLCSGRFDTGVQILRAVLDAVGVYFPKSPIAVIFSVLLVRIALAVRGLSYRERPEGGTNPHTLVRLDAIWAAGAGFSMTDNIRGAYFQTRNLLLALRVGDSRRVARALGMEVCFRAAGGSKTTVRTRQLLAREWELAKKVGTAEALAMANTAAAYTHYMVADWSEAKRYFLAAEEIFRDRCVGVTFQLNSSRLMLYRTLAYQGNIRELGLRVPPVLREVEQHADHYSVLNLVTGPMVLVGLAEDEPDRVRRASEDAMDRLSRGAFLVQHYFALQAQCQLDLYEGNGGAAHGRLQAAWPALQRSLLLRVQVIRIMAIEQRCRCAVVASSSRTSDSAGLIRAAENDVKLLLKTKLPWGDASAALMRGTIAGTKGNVDDAVRELKDAADRFGALGMDLYVAAATRRRGELLAGDEGRSLVENANALLVAQGVRDTERMVSTLIPRFKQ